MKGRFVNVLIVIVSTTFVVSAAVPEGVSPGATDRLSRVTARCPTFNWAAVDHSLFYELVAYSLPEYLDDASVFNADLGEATEVLFTTVAGGAGGWTPETDQALAAGGRFVWFVRAVTEVQGDVITEATEWSRARFFTIPAVPTVDEVSRDLEVLQRYVARGGDPASVGAVQIPSNHEGRGTRPVRRFDAANKSIPTASAAIRGEHPDGSGEVYGIIGITASADGAGVAAANSAGGADLILDGSHDGVADTMLTESGIYREVSGDHNFELRNKGEGSLGLDVGGDLSADSLGVNRIDVGGSTVIDYSGSWLGAGSTVPCDGCVSSADLEDAAIIAADLATGAVTSDQIRDGTIMAADLGAGSVVSGTIRNNAVTSSHIADGVIGRDDLGDASVVNAKLSYQAVTADKIAAGAVWSSNVQNGTLTAADVSPTGGIYASKSGVYIVEDSLLVPDHACGGLTVHCNDANDLPLQGACRVNTQYWILAGDSLEYWDTEAEAAEYLCTACNESSVDRSFSAKIACVSVPGS